MICRSLLSYLNMPVRDKAVDKEVPEHGNAHGQRQRNVVAQHFGGSGRHADQATYQAVKDRRARYKAYPAGNFKQYALVTCSLSLATN